MRGFINFASLVVAGVLLFFAGRRWLFALAAVTAKNRAPDGVSALADVLLVVPFRNEAETLPELLAALAQLDYPAAKLTVVLVDDGSTDGSAGLVQPYLVGRPNWYLLTLPANLGKADALNAALAQFSQGQFIAVYDADDRPESGALRQLTAALAQPGVGAVSGRRTVSNGLASPAASYVALESLVHQQITMRAKDRLNLAPAILGANCAYRRAALAEVGGFRPGALLEDTDLTLKLALAGWRLRFVPAAVSLHRAPESLAGYWRQHTRWARGFNEVAREHAGALWRDRRLSPLLRLELLAFAAGYLDRLALLLGAALALTGSRAAAGAVAISLISPWLQIAAALKIDGQPAAMWARLGWVPLFFAVDLAMALAGWWRTVVNSPRVWEERRQRR